MNTKQQIHQYWQQTPQKYTQYYKEQHITFKKYFQIFQQTRTNKILTLLQPTLTKNDEVLDIGCGNAQIETLIAQHVKSITAIDYSAQMLKIAKQNLKAHNIKNCILIHGNANKITTKKKFDTILLIGVIDYLENYQKCFKQIQEHSKPGTELIITFPAKNSPFFLMRTTIGNYLRRKIFNAPPIINTFTKKQKTNLLQQHGFKEIETHKIHQTMYLTKARRTFQ